MKDETLLQVQAYLDNELSPADARKVAEVISADPEARAIYQELKDTRELLVNTGEAPLRLQDSRDFYWSQVQRRITAAEPRAARPASTGAWWIRLVAPLTGAAALFAVLLSLSDPSQTTPTELASRPASVAPRTPFHHVESQPEYSTITFRSESEGMTVVWVDTQ